MQLHDHRLAWGPCSTVKSQTRWIMFKHLLLYTLIHHIHTDTSIYILYIHIHTVTYSDIQVIVHAIHVNTCTNCLSHSYTGMPKSFIYLALFQWKQYTCKYIQVHTHTYIYMHIHAYTCIYMHIHALTAINTQVIHILSIFSMETVYMQIHTGTYTYIHIHTYTYIYIHIHANSCTNCHIHPTCHSYTPV